MRKRRGQIILLLLFVLMVLVFLALLNVDIFTSVRAKTKLQNAGDAAAIAAASKQGSLLNEIGNLNIAHIVAAFNNDSNECERIVLEQRRKALLGPVEALRMANRAAKKNGMEINDGFAAILRRHVDDIRTVYASSGSGPGAAYPEPFPGAWVDYATAIGDVLSEGMATGPDNVEFYDTAGGHLLLNRQFYYAISGRDWCWFHFNCRNMLTDYGTFRDWAPLPSNRENSMDNSEIFSLHVRSRRIALTSVLSREEICALAEQYSNERISPDDIGPTSLLADPGQTWFFFDNSAWHQWFNGLSLAGDSDNYQFPIAGNIKDEYNVRGCAAVCRCTDAINAVAVESRSEFNWSAAAKPFGSVVNFNGDNDVVTAYRSFIVPSFTDVRLIAIDTVGGQNLATADFAWVIHMRDHLLEYLRQGPGAAGYGIECFYCVQLKTWERESFRRTGERWLKFNSGSCVRPTYGGPSGQGGTSHGH